MPFSLLTWAVIAANVLGAAMALPQAAKLLRHRRVDGVSSRWAGMSVAVNAWWGVYGFGVGELSIIPVSVISVLSYSVITVALVRYRSSPLRSVLGPVAGSVAAVGLVPLAAFAAGGWSTAGIALGALYGVQLCPAVVVVYRAHDVSGVSAATWTIALAEALLWGLYGFARVDAGLLALALTGSILSSVVLVRLFVWRPRHRTVVARSGLDLAVG